MFIGTRTLDVATAYLGMTVRHIVSQRTYLVESITPAKAGHDTILKIRDAHGKGGFVGHEFLDPDNFVSVHN